MKPFYILTGPPGAGKTSVIHALSDAVDTVSEPARRVLEVERAHGGTATGEQDPSAFIARMQALALQDMTEMTGPTLFDRALPDLLAYASYYKLPLTGLREVVKQHRYYSTVFWLPSWEEIYTQDAERTLSFREAHRFGGLVRKYYLQSGYQMLDLPRVSAEERAELILERIDR